MSRLSLWNSGKKGADYTFTDRIISGHFFASGTAVYVHKYLGPHDQTDYSKLPPGTPPKALTESSIQDVLLLENRDRKYDQTVYELRGCYNVQDNDFDMKQFGLFLTSDTLFMEFHLNDMIALIGRKLMSGDVLELPHQRDDALLNDGPAINKFYVITDANRASSGYSANWWPHIWRIKMEPMKASQEFADILEREAQNPFLMDQGLIGDLISTRAKELDINEQVVEQAIDNVKARNFETRQFYVVPGDEGAQGKQNPWIYAGDGAPPNGLPVEKGTRFPADPTDGDYFLRLDYTPQVLFKFESKKWHLQELDYRRGHWSVAHRLLEDFINNDAIETYKDGGQEKQKVGLYKAIKPKEDF